LISGLFFFATVYVVETPQISAVSSDKTANKYSPFQQFYENRDFSRQLAHFCADPPNQAECPSCCRLATSTENL